MESNFTFIIVVLIGGDYNHRHDELMDFVSVIMKAHEDDYNDNFDHWHWLFPKSGSNKALSVYFKKGSDGFDTRIQPTHLRVDIYDVPFPNDTRHKAEVEFVHAVSAGGSVKFLPAV